MPVVARRRLRAKMTPLLARTARPPTVATTGSCESAHWSKGLPV